MNTAGDTQAHDKRFLDAALRLARKHQGLTGTNPSVACLLVKDLGHGPVVVGSAVTALGGRPHAEPPALDEAGVHAKNATAYVTLEPCAHHGKTPPCAQTLIDAGISRIVTAIADPDERVNGKGHQMMADAGIEICQIDGGAAARRVMAGYLAARSEKRPFVTLKLAITPDGIIGSRNRGNMKISCTASNRQTHLSRARHDAILVGSGTAIADDPNLTCRLPGMETRSPLRVVLDLKARLTREHQLISQAIQFPTLIAGSADAPAEWQAMLRMSGVQFLACETQDGQVALPELLDDLYARGIQSVMVEGGAAVAKSFLDEDLVDEIIVHVGGDPEYPETDICAVKSPLSMQNLPANFELCQTLQFGVDQSLRLQRKKN
ncbi:MAG: bifunctional diaminohydroxyphosphoribosylaminopyrimidine deaminase/5-amino-6-(5-phosphoribosylamino)uracil reductase RibD [Rhizobiaceae bacterium]|nr:bifunctional diaminohydroxyphosphoribosylaminopyrimidine deaminase/5-amino-6-(5-phosphoribosylamino)uracil reductase RibD [Rhizobiaceae bacterium]